MKRRCSLAEIRAEMQRRIDGSDWGNGYCSGCPAPTPYRIPFDGVSNWTATVASTAKPRCEGLVLDIVAALRKECKLKPESLAYRPPAALARLGELETREPRMTVPITAKTHHNHAIEVGARGCGAYWSLIRCKSCKT
jgi:hypothetical protein